MQARPLYWSTRKWALWFIALNTMVSYTFLMGEDAFNKVTGWNQTTGCYALAWWMPTTVFMVYLIVHTV